MKLTKRDVSVLLYIVAIMSIFLVYQLYYSSTVKEAETVLEECVGLQGQVDELQAKVAQQPQYEDDIADMKEKIREVLALYPSSISEEDIILYVKELNDELDMDINGVTFSGATPIYSVVGSGHAAQYNFNTESITINVNYSTTYDGLKKIVNYINEDPEHREINSLSIDINPIDTAEQITISEDESEAVSRDTITGNISIVLYLIDGKPVQVNEEGETVSGEESTRFVIPEVEHGVNDIFRTEETTAASQN